MRNLVLLLFLIPALCFGQRVTYGFASLGTQVNGHDKIIKDTLCQNCVYDYENGNIPTMYHWIQYNIFEPPGYFEIMKWFWTEFPKTQNGWGVEYEKGWSISGWTEGIHLDKVNLSCDTCDYLIKYTYDVSFIYGVDDKVELTVKQNKDTTNKYMAIKHPELFK